jgi:hypothetical protein
VSAAFAFWSFDSEPEAMPKVLKSAGALQRDDASANGPITLKCTEHWSSALLQVSGRGGSVMKVVAVRGTTIMAGIAPADADIFDDLFRRVGHHIHFGGLWYGEGGIENRTVVGLPHRELAHGKELHLRYVRQPQPELAVSLDGKSFTRVPAEFAHANYVGVVVCCLLSAIDAAIGNQRCCFIPASVKRGSFAGMQAFGLGNN